MTLCAFCGFDWDSNVDATIVIPDQPDSYVCLPCLDESLGDIDSRDSD